MGIVVNKESRRISVDIPHDLYIRLSNHVDHGMRGLVYTRVTEAIVDLFDRHGKIAIGFLSAGRFELRLKPGEPDTVKG